MSMFGYVNPEQSQREKADFARKNIARGRPLIAVSAGVGIVLCAENRSTNLHKLAEVYDRIAFAGVGKYNEFDQLRQMGVRLADLTGYRYSREDVTARSITNAYAQTIGQVFTDHLKPLEVELLVAEVGATQADDQLFRILYDGTVIDEDHHAVLGGDAESIGPKVADLPTDADLATTLRAAVAALAGDRTLDAADLEVAILERASSERRAFRRLEDAEVAGILGSPEPAAPPAATT